MNTRKFTGDMASQVEADRDELIELRAKCKKLRAKCERLEGELKAWQDEFGTDDVKESAEEFDEQYRKVSQLEAQCAEMRSALEHARWRLSREQWPMNSHDWQLFHEWRDRFVNTSSTTDCGKAILSRLDEARRLIESYTHSVIAEKAWEWNQRRDAWLKGQP